MGQSVVEVDYCHTRSSIKNRVAKDLEGICQGHPCLFPITYMDADPDMSARIVGTRTKAQWSLAP